MGQRLKVMQILTGSFFVTLFVFGGVLSVSMVGEPSVWTWTDPQILPLLIAAISSAGAIPMLRRRLMGNAALPGLGGAQEESVPRRLDKDALRLALDKGIATYHQGSILGLALAESVAVFGFVLAMLHGDIMLYVPFSIASALLMAWQFPTQAGLLSILDPEARATARERSL